MLLWTSFMRARVGIVLCVTLGCVFASSTTASECMAKNDETKRQCIASAENAQNLRMSNKPLAARAALRECVRDACPRAVRSRCAKWLEENEAAIPTVVLNARDASGADVVDVEVSVDGKPFARALDGGALPLEPGEHAFEYARAGKGPIVRTRVLLGTGEKNRLVSVTLADASAPAAVTLATESSVTPEPSRSSHPSRTLAWVFAGVSVVAAGSFAYFGITGQSELRDLRAQCAGHCSQSTAQPTWNKLIAADVSLGVGVVSAALATYFFLRTPTEAGEMRETQTGLVVSPSPRGASVGWIGAF